MRGLFASKPVDRPPFIPLLAAAVADFMQVPVQRLYSDPTALANSLQACQRLFKHDAVALLCDSTLEAEALGCEVEWDPEGPRVVSGLDVSVGSLNSEGIESQGRVPIVLEAARRLLMTIGKEVAVLSIVTGPAALYWHLRGGGEVDACSPDDAEWPDALGAWENVAVSMARAYGELKVDGLIVVDSALGCLGSSRFQQLGAAFKTLHNVTAFYDMPLIVHSTELPPEAVADLAALDADGFTVSDLPEGERLPAGKICGIRVPLSLLSRSLEDISGGAKAALEAAGSRNVFVTTEGQVPAGTPAANLHSLVQAIAAGS